MARLRVLVGILVLVVAAGGGFLLGQDSKDGGKVRGQLPPNWGKLGLTDKQKQTVYRIQADYKKKIDPLDQKVQELRKQERSELLKVLNEDQRERLKEIISSKAGGEAAPKDGQSNKDKKQ